MSEGPLCHSDFCSQLPSHHLVVFGRRKDGKEKDDRASSVHGPKRGGGKHSVSNFKSTNQDERLKLEGK